MFTELVFNKPSRLGRRLSDVSRASLSVFNPHSEIRSPQSKALLGIVFDKFLEFLTVGILRDLFKESPVFLRREIFSSGELV